jgi:hypothetical protein
MASLLKVTIFPIEHDENYYGALVHHPTAFRDFCGYVAIHASVNIYMKRGVSFSAAMQSLRWMEAGAIN